MSFLRLTHPGADAPAPSRADHPRQQEPRQTWPNRSRLLPAAAFLLCAFAALLLPAASQAAAPLVTIENAKVEPNSSVHVAGTGNPEGEEAKYRFQYATQPDFSDALTGAEQILPDYEAPVPLEATFTVNCNTTYYLRLVVENEDGQSKAVAAKTFSTGDRECAGFQVAGYFNQPELPPGGEAILNLSSYDIGTAPSSAEPITLVNTLPAGLSYASIPGGCTAESASVISCEVPGIPHQGNIYSWPGLFAIAVSVADPAPGQPQPDRVEVSGGGAIATSATTVPVRFGASPAPFGFATIAGWLSRDDGTIDTQAGSHPNQLTFVFDLNQAREEGGVHELIPINGEIAGLDAAGPAGLIGNPTAVPQCTRAKFEEGEFQTGRGCPAASQVGEDTPEIQNGLLVSNPIYNLVPPHGVAAEFGFTIANVNTVLDAHVRSDGDYGITEHIAPIVEHPFILGNTATLWGVPGDPAHDVSRSGKGFGCTASPSGCGFAGPVKPLLTAPTACLGPQSFEAEALGTWQEPSLRTSSSFLVHDGQGNPAGFDGCNQLEFKPTIEAKATTNLADSPTGYDFDLHVPQNEDPEGLATADLKDATVTLPEGLVVNPSSANGLEACSPAQIGMTTAVGQTPAHFTDQPNNCPEAAKIGSVEVNSPLADHPLLGGVYLASQERNPFASLLAIYIVVEDPVLGVVIKLPALVRADPSTGRLSATVTESPQLPFEDFHFDFFNGPHASLKTPATCGSFQTTTDLTPWSSPEGADATPADSFALSGPPSGVGACPSSEAGEPDKPSFSAGTLDPIAGAFSPFVLKVSREDGSQRLGVIETTLPPGMSGRLAGIPYCPQADIEAAEHRSKPGQGALEKSSPSCPAASEVGTVDVGGGAGTTPVYVSGHAYLAGPYKGAPLSLAIITPAIAGPFDLGTVVVRTALYVNPETAQITAKSDPLPSILQGIPLDIRSVAIKMSRANFTLNPTNCERSSVLGTTTSLLGQGAGLSTPSQVGGCKALAFKPKLSLSLKGGTKRNRNPAFKATLTMPPGGANIARAQVTLPHSEFLDQSHIKTICTRVQFAAGAGNGAQCPAGSIYGRARAITPLLDKPLEGPVYLRSSSHNLPDMVAALNGQIDVDLDGRIDTGKGGGIRNTFEAVPDAPVSKFTLELNGGKKGLLVNSENICRKPQQALAHFVGQNGKVDDFSPVIANGCGKGKKRAGHHGRAGK